MTGINGYIAEKFQTLYEQNQTARKIARIVNSSVLGPAARDGRGAAAVAVGGAVLLLVDAPPDGLADVSVEPPPPPVAAEEVVTASVADVGLSELPVPVLVPLAPLPPVLSVLAVPVGDSVEPVLALPPPVDALDELLDEVVLPVAVVETVVAEVALELEAWMLLEVVLETMLEAEEVVGVADAEVEVGDVIGTMTPDVSAEDWLTLVTGALVEPSP